MFLASVGRCPVSVAGGDCDLETQVAKVGFKAGNAGIVVSRA